MEKRTRIDELDTAMLLHDIAEEGLERGDVGVVVHRYADGAAHEVEFVTGAGETMAALTLEANAIRPMDRHEILRAQELVA